MTAREQLLTRVRGALGRSAQDRVPEAPAVRMAIPKVDHADRVAQFSAAQTALAGRVWMVDDVAGVRGAVEQIVAGRTFIASDTFYSLPGIDGNASDRGQAVDTADVGINFADYALADTGSLVFLSESRETRLISLLPPVHIAIVAGHKILSGLDELFTLVPRPAAESSSMVIVTGPSRTADIEMRLVRGVHGPGEVHVIVVRI